MFLWQSTSTASDHKHRHNSATVMYVFICASINLLLNFVYVVQWGPCTRGAWFYLSMAIISSHLTYIYMTQFVWKMMKVRARGGVRDCSFFFFNDIIHMKLIRKLTTLLLLFYVITFSLFSLNHAVEKIIFHYNYVILFLYTYKHNFVYAFAVNLDCDQRFFLLWSRSNENDENYNTLVQILKIWLTKG